MSSMSYPRGILPMALILLLVGCQAPSGVRPDLPSRMRKNRLVGAYGA